jgi:hypothetical protein
MTQRVCNPAPDNLPCAIAGLLDLGPGPLTQIVAQFNDYDIAITR